MGGRKEESNNLAADALKELDSAEHSGLLDTLKTNYDTDLGNLKGYNIQNFYEGLNASTIKMETDKDGNYIGDFGKGQRSGETFDGDAAQAKKQILDPAKGYSDNVAGYKDGVSSTNVQGLRNRSNSGLSNSMNNLQVSTAGSEMAAQEADQSLAASQDLAAQAGTGAGGATALAAAAAKSKQGISADIDRQVKANEQLRAQGEQSLQRDQLGQDNLASNFDLGQSQFNIGAENTMKSQVMSANNQARQFDATQQNQFAQSRFSAENQRQQFNASQSNAERMAEFGALQNANAANAGAINNALAQNSQTQTNFDLSQAAGNTANDQALYGQTNDILNLSTEQLNNEEASNDALQQIIAAGDSAPS